MIQQTNGGGPQSSADRIQPINERAHLTKHGMVIGQRASTVSQDRASRLQQQPQGQNSTQNHAERRANKVQPPNNLNLIHPSATLSKDFFNVPGDHTFTSNSILSQLKSGNYGSHGRDKQMDPTADRCMTTTAASAPKNFASEMTLTLNSAKNQVSSMGTQALPWEAILKQQKATSAAKNSDQPASLKRRESSAKTGNVTYNSQGQSQTSTKNDSQLQFFPSNKASVPQQPAVRNSVQNAQAAAIFLQPQQLKLLNMADQQQYALDQIANFPSSSKSQKSVKSTKSSKGKAQFTAAIQRGVIAQPPMTQQPPTQQPHPRQMNKQSPSVERDQARLEKLQSAPKTVAKKKPLQQQNNLKAQVQQQQQLVGSQQTLSQKKQQRVKFNVVNQNGLTPPTQTQHPQASHDQPQPDMMIHQSDEGTVQITKTTTTDKASPTATTKPQHLNHLNLNSVGANSVQAFSSKPGSSVPPKNHQSVTNNSTINTPKQNLKFKSQTKGSTQAPNINSLSGILFDQQSQTKQSSHKNTVTSQAINDSGSTEAPNNRQYHSQAYTDNNKVTTVKKSQSTNQQQTRGQGSETKASRQSIQASSNFTTASQQNSQQFGATGKTSITNKTKSTSIKRSTGATSKPSVQNQQIAAKSQTTMMVKASQQQPKTGTKRVPSNLASHEKIRVAKGTNNQGSSERSPNGLSSQDARSTKAANKSFQFGHQTQLMSCSSGGESSTNQVTKNRSLSGKQKGGPQIKIRQNLGVLPQDMIMTNLQFQPGTTTACIKTQHHLDDSYNNQLLSNMIMPATTQNNQENIKTFSFIKDDVNQKRKKFEIQKGDQSNKHNAMICLKNVRSGNSTSQDSKTRKPQNQATVPSLQLNTVKPQLISSQSPTPANLKYDFKNQVKTNFASSDLTDKKEKMQFDEQQRRLQLSLKETSNQSYSIPVHSGMHSVKSTGHGNKSIKVQKHFQQQQSVEPEPVQEQSEGETPEQGIIVVQQRESPDDKKQIMNDLAELNYKQTEIIKLLSNTEEKDKRERSKERIQETLKSLEMRLDNFSQISNQHTQFIKQIAYLQRQSHSRQSNFSVNSNKQGEGQHPGGEEKKASGTPQPRNWVDEQTMDYIANLPNFEKSARLLLVINEEPRLSLISEGLNSLITVDEYLMTTHQVSANMPGSSEGPQTMRQVSKCSLECPGGTSDDLSIVSLSEILADDHHLEMYVGFQSTNQRLGKTSSRFSNDDDRSDDDDVLTLADVVVEEKTEASPFSGQQSAPQIPIIKNGLMADERQLQQAEDRQRQSIETDIDRLSKSQKIKKEEILHQVIRSKLQSKDDQDKSRVIQLAVPDKPTNLSANSAEMNAENQQIFHSLERIRQESGGSQMIGKKISFFKNQFKIKQSHNGQTVNTSDRQDTSIQVISKKTLAMIKSNMGATPNVYLSNDVIIGPDDSCEISGIVNASDNNSSTAARGFSSLVASLPHRIDNYMQKQDQAAAASGQVPGGKSSGSISPFHPKFRIQQRSLERDQLFFGKSSQIKHDAQQEGSFVDTSSGNMNQQNILLGQLGCATPKSIPSGKTIMISKQKFQTVLGQNKSPEVVQPQKPQQNHPTSFSASQLTEIIQTQQQPKKEKKLQIMVKHPMGGSGETFDLLQNKMRMVKSLNRGGQSSEN